jgi:ankyrin repeat protein
VRVLLDWGADVHARSDTWGEVMAVPPHGAPENRKDIPHGADTPLLFAARVGDLASAKLLLAAGSDVNESDAWGVSAVTLAAHSGFTEMVTYLLDKGADPNEDGAGFTALHVAIMRRDETMARALLDHGANANAPLKTWTPTRRASDDWNFHQALVGATPWWLAARFDEPVILKLLAQHGADATFVHHASYVEAAGSYGSGGVHDQLTALMAAVGMGVAGNAWVQPKAEELPALMLETVKLVVDAGADVNAKNAQGRTANDQASSRGLKPISDYLVSKGATPSTEKPQAGGRRRG